MISSRVNEALVEQWLTPDWVNPTPAIRQRVRAYVTTRAGDLSAHPYDGFNTANHVGDDPGHVAANRQSLAGFFNWQQEPQWLKQVHGIQVVEAQADGVERTADAVFTTAADQVCTLHTADCLPVFFTNDQAEVVALAHAGWRGLAAGILEQTVERLGVPPETVQVWLGPAIGQDAFEVGEDVREAFCQHTPRAEPCFRINSNERWQCDLCGLARLRLQQVGVTAVSGGGFCTFHDSRFFSYRRQSVTGRLLSLIWLDAGF